MEDKAMFPSASEAILTTATECAGSEAGPAGAAGEPSPPSFAPRSPYHQPHSASELLNMFAQQEPRPADVAPSSDLDDIMLNLSRMGGSEINFDEPESNSNNYLNYFMQGSRAESVASGRAQAWPESSRPRSNNQMSTFDFLVKSVSAANNYVSMLTREQLHVLQSIRPSLLFEFLQEVAEIRSNKRMRRALPNECAFCKNNGESEEFYSDHLLKDYRGRVRCPVLRAFRCPRCGATGDNAHTIKYCQENNDAERSTGLGARRRAPPSVSLPFLSGGNFANGGSSGISSMPQTPTHGPPSSASSFNPGLWSSFGLN